MRNITTEGGTSLTIALSFSSSAEIPGSFDLQSASKTSLIPRSAPDRSLRFPAGAGSRSEGRQEGAGLQFVVAPMRRTWCNWPVDQLLELLRERGFRRGRFVLSSGKESDFFIDCKPVVLLARGHVLVGEALLARIRDLPGPLSAVAGVELGGCPLASAVAYASTSSDDPLDAVYIRKEAKPHGTRKTLEGADGLTSGSRLAIVEDTVTTGRSTLRAIDAVREAGFDVAGVVAVVDRLEGGAEVIADAGVSFSALYDRTDFMGQT